MKIIEVPVNPIALAISSGATFAARFAGDVKHLKKTLVDAVKHRGFNGLMFSSNV